MTNKELLYILIMMSSVIVILMGATLTLIWTKVLEIRAVVMSDREQINRLAERLNELITDSTRMNERIDRNTMQLDLLLNNKISFSLETEKRVKS